MSAEQLVNMLARLATSYHLKLESDPDGLTFTLTLGRPNGCKQAQRNFIYIGSLHAVISRAWAGQPPDQLGEYE